MPDDLNLDSGLITESPKPRRIRPTAPHLDVLTEFAKENNLQVGSTTGGRHNKGSLHYSKNAMDIKGSGAFDDARVRALSHLAAERSLLLRDERRRPKGQKVWGGPHIHIEYAGQDDPQNLSSGVKDDLNLDSGLVSDVKPTVSPRTVTPPITEALDKLTADVNKRMGRIKPASTLRADQQPKSPYDVNTILTNARGVRREPTFEEDRRARTAAQAPRNLRQVEESEMGQRKRIEADVKNYTPSILESKNPADIVNERISAERDAQTEAAKHQEWERRNQQAIADQTAEYRADIQKAKARGGDANKWLAEMGTKASTGLTELAGATLKPVAPELSNKLRVHVLAAQRAAEEEGADRNSVSKAVQDIAGGFIASAPELAAMSAGIPAPVAFGAGSGARAYAEDRPVVPAVAHGAATGAAFEIPVAGQGVTRALKRAGTVGTATAGVDLASGATPAEALKSGATNALLVGAPEVIGGRRNAGEQMVRDTGGREPVASSAEEVTTRGGETVAAGQGLQPNADPRVQRLSEERNLNARQAEAQHQGVQAEQPTETTQPRIGGSGDLGRPSKTAPKGTEGVTITTTAGSDSAVTPQRFQHVDFGEVEATPSQEGARRGKIRVAEAGNPENIHYIKTTTPRGRGNGRAIPLKTESPVVAPPERMPRDVSAKSEKASPVDPDKYAEFFLDKNPISLDELDYYAGRAGKDPHGIPDEVWQRAFKKKRDSITVYKGATKDLREEYLGRLVDNPDIATKYPPASSASPTALAATDYEKEFLTRTSGLIESGRSADGLVKLASDNPDLFEKIVEGKANDNEIQQFRTVAKRQNVSDDHVRALEAEGYEQSRVAGQLRAESKAEPISDTARSRPEHTLSSEKLRVLQSDIERSVNLDDLGKVADELSNVRAQLGARRKSLSATDRSASMALWEQENQVWRLIRAAHGRAIQLNLEGMQDEAGKIRDVTVQIHNRLSTLPAEAAKPVRPLRRLLPVAEGAVNEAKPSQLSPTESAPRSADALPQLSADRANSTIGEPLDVPDSSLKFYRLTTHDAQGRAVGTQDYVIDHDGVVTLVESQINAATPTERKSIAKRLDDEMAARGHTPSAFGIPYVEGEHPTIPPSPVKSNVYDEAIERLPTSSVAEGSQLPDRGTRAGSQPESIPELRKSVRSEPEEIAAPSVAERAQGAKAKSSEVSNDTTADKPGVVADAQNKPSITSARKEMFKADRAELDLPELPPAERRGWQETLDRAKEKGTQNAGILADEVLAKPRALNDTETAQLVLRAQEIKNEHSRVMREIGESTNPSEIQSKRAQSEALESEFDRLTRATKASGTEKGRALASQKLTINQDFDLVSLVQRMKAAKGRELRPDERARYEQMASEHAELTRKLADVEERAKVSHLQKDIDRVVRQRRRSETKATLDDEFASLRAEFAKAKAEIPRVQASGLAGLDPEGTLTKLIGKMARNRVKAGTIQAEALVDEIYSAVKEHLPDLSKRDVRDAISGYSIAPKSTRTELQKQLDVIRSELQSLSKGEDVEAGIRSPRREGPRQSEARGLPAEGPRKSEARSSGIPLEGPKRSDITKVPLQGPRQSEARQSGVPLQGPKLGDIRRVPAQGPRLSDAARSGQPLQGPKPSEAYKLKAEGPVRSVEGVPKQVFTRDATRRRQLLAQEAELVRRMGAEDYSETPKREPPKYTRETYQIQKRLNEVKQQYEKDKYRATRDTTGKLIDTAAGIGNVPKTLLSMGDISALFRQGGYGFVTHPILSSKAAVDMVKSFSERGFANVEHEIKNHPKFDEAKRNGVEFTGIDKDDPHLSKREEGYLGADFIDTLARGRVNPLRIVKGVKNVSERTFVSFLDSQRMRLYDAQSDAIRGMKLTPEQMSDALKAQAKLINMATGRGSLGRQGNQAAPLLNVAMFSPRLLASRVQILNKMLNPVAWARQPKGSRSLMMKDNAKFLAFTMTTLGLAKAAGLNVNLDPDDADFLKIKVGDTRYDHLTGLQQPLRFFLRMASAVKGGETYSGDTKSDILMDFGRSKASPAFGYGWDFMEGKNRLSGKQFEAGKDLARTLVPLPMQDFAEAIKNDGALLGMVKAMPSLTGIGVQTYKGAAEKPTTQAEKLARRMIIRKMPDEAREQSEIDKDQKLSQLRLRSRQGENVEAEVAAMGLTSKKAKSILSARDKSRLQEDFNRLSLKDAIIVYGTMSPAEQMSIREILERKASSVDLLPAEQQDEVKPKLEGLGMKLGILPRKPREARTERKPRGTQNEGYVFQ